MFCIKCGKQLPGEAAFCLYCGAPIAGGDLPHRTAGDTSMPAVHTFPSVEDREQAMSRLKEACNYFGKKREQYNYYNQLCNAIANYRVRGKTGLAWLSGIAFFIAMVAVCGSLDVIRVGFGLGFILSVTLIVLIYSLTRNKSQATLASMQECAIDVEKRLHNYYEEYVGATGSKCPVAYDFSHPDVVYELVRLISTGRADSTKEAINIMLDDLHKSNVENTQQQILYRTGQAANAAKAGAFLSAANFVATITRR